MVGNPCLQFREKGPRESGAFPHDEGSAIYHKLFIAASYDLAEVVAWGRPFHVFSELGVLGSYPWIGRDAWSPYPTSLFGGVEGKLPRFTRRRVFGMGGGVH
jgi:hypothetical protein